MSEMQQRARKISEKSDISIKAYIVFFLRGIHVALSVAFTRRSFDVLSAFARR